MDVCSSLINSLNVSILDFVYYLIIFLPKIVESSTKTWGSTSHDQNFLKSVSRIEEFASQ